MVEVDVAVVGGGQAGLAAGRELVDRDVDALIVDASAGPGEVWRRRWDSLRLFTPAAYSSLPGLAFPGPPDALPGKDDVADYLGAYAARFDLPARWSTPVTRLRRAGDRFALTTASGEQLTARQVVVATGAHQRPWRPALADRLGGDVLQLHTAAYRNPGQLPDGPVLIVGGGNSGVQIAAELAATHLVTLALGTRTPVIPARVAGRSVFHWLDALGLLRIPTESRLGRRAARAPEPVIGDAPQRLRRRLGVRLVGRIVAAGGRAITDVDGGVHRPATVVWATGYRADWSWIDVPGALDADGLLVQRCGVTPVPGLSTIGLPRQCTSGSAMFTGLGPDATALATRTAAALRRPRGTPAAS